MNRNEISVKQTQLRGRRVIGGLITLLFIELLLMSFVILSDSISPHMRADIVGESVKDMLDVSAQDQVRERFLKQDSRGEEKRLLIALAMGALLVLITACVLRDAMRCIYCDPP